MRDNINSNVSILLSWVCILVLISINIGIAHDYPTNRKSQGLFEEFEFILYIHKYYMVPVEMISITFAIIGIKKENRKAKVGWP